MGILQDGLASRVPGGKKGEMPFLDHLEELRFRLFWSIGSIVVASGLSFWLIKRFQVLDLLIGPMKRIMGEDWTLIYLGPADAFFMLLKLAITTGIILAFPVIVYHVWGFLAPALEKHEKRAIIPALYMGLVLFLAGVAMAYFIALPVSLQFLLGFLTDFMTPQLEATRYYSFVIKMLIGFGVVFELPVVIMVLSALGLVTPAFLRSKRRHAIVIITVVASFLSPGDVITVTVLMMVPLVFLYEFSIFLSSLIYRRRQSHENSIADPTPPDGSQAVAGAARPSDDESADVSED